MIPYILVFSMAALFAVIFWFIRTRHLGWTFLLFALLVIPLCLLAANHFYTQDTLPLGLLYLVLCGWIAGMVVPWVLSRKTFSLIWFVINLLLYPAAFFIGLEFGEASWIYQISLIALTILFVFNLTYLFWVIIRN